jgi:rhomboid protease GluP
MYGHLRFIAIYFVSGLSGNLLSLVIQGNVAVSGGASGAIFGIYGALITFLWRERAAIAPHEFRWLFWGAMVFATISLAFGFIVPGIDNSAHIGGFMTGILMSIIFATSINAKALPIKAALTSAGIMMLSITLLILNIPAPKYRWSEELLLRKTIDEFLYQDQAINRSWLEIMQEGKKNNTTNDGLANHIDSTISERYEDSFEKLSQLPINPALPSATKLENVLKYVQQRKTESKAIADKLRTQQPTNLGPYAQ